MRTKMRTVLTAGLILGLVVSSFCIGRATSTPRFDEPPVGAIFWRNLSANEQLTYVEGLVDGYFHGYIQGDDDGAWRQAEYQERVNERFFVGTRAPLFKAYTAAIEQTKGVAPDTASLLSFPDTFKTYVDGVTNFYDNHDKADRRPGDILACLWSKSSAWCK